MRKGAELGGDREVHQIKVIIMKTLGFENIQALGTAREILDIIFIREVCYRVTVLYLAIFFQGTYELPMLS